MRQIRLKDRTCGRSVGAITDRRHPRQALSFPRDLATAYVALSYGYASMSMPPTQRRSRVPDDRAPGAYRSGDAHTLPVNWPSNPKSRPGIPWQFGSTCRAMTMIKADYLDYALQCVELALRSRDVGERAQWVALAEEWTQRAAKADQLWRSRESAPGARH
jgi:hypothetical protein